MDFGFDFEGWVGIALWTLYFGLRLERVNKKTTNVSVKTKHDEMPLQLVTERR